MHSIARVRFLAPRRIVALGVLPLLVWVWVVGTMAAPSEASEAKLVGTLDRLPADFMAKYGPVADIDPGSGIVDLIGQVVLVPSERLAVQVFQIALDGGVKKMVLYLRDLDTLKTRKIIEVDANLEGPDNTIYTAVDKAGRRLFIGDVAVHPFPYPEGFVVVNLAEQSAKAISYPNGLVKQYAKNGITFDDRTGRLYKLAASTCGGLLGCPGALNILIAMNADTGAIEYNRPLRSCRGTIPGELSDTTDPTVPVIFAKNLAGQWRAHVPCWIRQEVSGVVIVNPDDDRDTAESFIVGPPQMAIFLPDPLGRRVVFAGSPGSGLQEEGFVYDANTSAFVGALSLARQLQPSEKRGYGLDPETGTLFGLSDSHGLFFSQTRLNPIPQPETYAGYKGSPGYARIWYDPQTSRLFVLRDYQPDPKNTPLFFRRTKAYDIVSVPPPPEVPPAPDPDRNTQDVSESTETRVSFAGNGGAYGMRVLLARGVQGALPATGDGLNYLSLVNRDQVPNKCGFVDRQLSFALVGAKQGPLSLTNTGASGRAAEIEADDATKIDLEIPSRCDQLLFPGVLPSAVGTDNGVLAHPLSRQAGLPEILDRNLGRKWGYSPAECSGDDAVTSSRTGGSFDAGSAEVICAFERESLEAEATSRVSLPAISVAYMKSTVDIVRQSGKGVTVRSEAIARGIVLGDVSIGEIKTVAETKAAGRPGTAKSTFTREINGLFFGGNATPQSCKNKTCDEMLTRLNALFGGRAEFRFPAPDESICRGRNETSGDCIGTPRGAQSGIIKSEFRRASDNAMSGDSSREIPGLEVLVYNDNQWFGRARQLIQIAGVQATTSYNISALASFSGGDDLLSGFDSSIGELPEIGGVSDAGTSAGEGIIEKIVRKIVHPAVKGMRLLITSPREAVRAAAAWALILGPAMMAARRRQLRLLES